MGIVHLPSLDDYWSRDPLTHYAPITTRIPRWRFREISRYLHFVNNQHLAPRGSPTFDRLGKVRPVIDHFSLQFSALYNPSKNLAVDEAISTAMIKFQGRSALKQYMPMKPIKRGIKVWVLGDSTNGYFSRFDVYTGKQEIRHVGLGEHVVKKLTSELKRKNHHVYFDNFFTNVKLLEDLLEDGIYGCGTARRDRKGFPPALKKAALKNSLKQRGTSKTVQKGPVTATAWKDNRIVNVLSTTTQPTAIGSVLRRQKDGVRINVPCPEAIMSYNQHMGGVDRGDQLRGYYSC
ncbi:piggyBac transposable element-derived protein 4-like [Halichondria panicea]|uniref:piggyBac transposable element-derived protein 4-like n=1 Tax=Halichondria panicea TaxID=6063 RepID=UPI00312B6F44